jgi:hypothetical protein
VIADNSMTGWNTDTSFAEGAVALLRRITQPRVQEQDVERCEMCAEPIAAEHGHVASLSEHRLLCACRGCYLLFTREGAGARRLRAVPERYLSISGFTVTDEQWDLLAIPVDLVFFFGHSDDEDPSSQATIACYPSPAGATESLLDLELWKQIMSANAARSAPADPEPDVEALLLRRHEGGRVECFLVPIDACYELVGVVRQHWVGFAGGAEVWQHIDDFFSRLSERSRPYPA